MQWRELIEFEITDLRLYDFKTLFYRSIPVELLPLYVAVTIISVKNENFTESILFQFLAIKQRKKQSL